VTDWTWKAPLSDKVDTEGVLLARARDEDVDVGRESGLGVVLLVPETLAVSRRNIVFGCDLEVAIGAVALVDGALGVGAATLVLAEFHVLVHQGLVGILVLGVRVVEVGNGEADLDELVLELAAELHDLLAIYIVQLPVGL